MTWYDAVFDDGQKMRVVGPFASAAEAAEFGLAHHGEEVDYLGWALRTGRVELSQVIGAASASRADEPDNGWSGVVTRWDTGATHGFITDRDERSWFVSRDHLPDGLAALDVGTQVWFTGSPHPKQGKRYPQAYTVRFIEPGSVKF